MCVHGCVSMCFGMKIKVGAYRKRKGSSGKEGKGGGNTEPIWSKT